MTIREAGENIKNDKAFRILMVEGLRKAVPYSPRRVRGRLHCGSRVEDERRQMFRKVWGTEEGSRIRSHHLTRYGSNDGLKDACILYFWQHYDELKAKAEEA